jgi:hypothetical protein
MDSLFDSAWLKWGWAVRSAKTLDDEIVAYVQQSYGKRLFTTRTDYHAQRHCMILSVERIDPLPPRWGLLLGDVINSLRSTLDHVAWAVVQRGRTPNLTDTKARGVYFPYAFKAKDFKACLSRNLPGVRGADVAIIRRYQPYAQGKRNIPHHVFTPLPKLSSDDKHRTVQPLLMLPQAGGIKVYEPTDCVVTRIPVRVPRKPLEVGAEIQRAYVRKTGPNPQMHMEPELTAVPALNTDFWLEDWLTQSVSFAGRMLREFADPPDALFEIGIELPPRPWPPVPPLR